MEGRNEIRLERVKLRRSVASGSASMSDVNRRNGCIDFSDEIWSKLRSPAFISMGSTSMPSDE
jgi:hypothetical protein